MSALGASPPYIWPGRRPTSIDPLQTPMKSTSASVLAGLWSLPLPTGQRKWLCTKKTDRGENGGYSRRWKWTRSQALAMAYRIADRT